jgi:outer membrane protein assembly factor BamD (BamD/ComL family)
VTRPWVVAVLLWPVVGCSLPFGSAPPPRPDEAPGQLIARAETLALNGDYRGAEAAYRRVLDDPQPGRAAEQALLGLGRLAVAPENPDRDYAEAHRHFDRFVRDFPDSAWADDARAWRAVLAAFLALQEEAAGTRRDIEQVRRDAEQEIERLLRDAQRARQESQEQRRDARRAREETDEMRRDLERLKQLELELERQRRR